ncbi:hypothetical protein [Colwellia ponticola]|uniref:Uncharacterized protein n=1 Tax=Colwellia ponticola TaxID=2304625 RepID=A0A8H2JPR0_9GAMM|nr:hypothetical protein [Colwellia ponticola]TMM47650.1 hypothetical protein FCS21_01325 [Colwellia ponticola]
MFEIKALVAHFYGVIAFLCEQPQEKAQSCITSQQVAAKVILKEQPTLLYLYIEYSYVWY